MWRDINKIIIIIIKNSLDKHRAENPPNVGVNW